MKTLDNTGRWLAGVRAASIVLVGVLFAVKCANAQELITGTNNCDGVGTGTPVPGPWTAGPGSSWECQDLSGFGAPFLPYSAPNMFVEQTIAGTTHTIFQDVDISSYAEGDGSFLQTFTLQSRYNTVGGDRGAITLAFLDAGSGDLGGGTTSGVLASGGSWTLFVDTDRLPPANTETARITLTCNRLDFGDTVCDAFYDDVSYALGTNLPVELTGFAAKSDGEAVLLSWTTASETSNAGFEIERRTDTGFETIAEIVGDGDRQGDKTYEYRVENLAPGRHEFRLVQYDFDGTSSVGPIIEALIDIPGGYELTAPYPNPFNPQTTFSLVVGSDQEINVMAYDITGRLVDRLFTGSLPANERQKITFDASSLPSGSYVLRVIGETFNESKMVVLAK